MSRVLPTAPGWWWMRRLYTSGPTKPQAVEVIRAYDGVLVVRQDIEVAHPRFDWLEPIPAPGEVEALRRQVAELQAERDALQAACVCAGCGARDGTCDEDGLCDGCGCDVIVGSIGAVEAVERLREERESYESELSDVREGLHTVTAQRDRLALDATLEAEALRRQVAELTALGVEAEDRGRKGERAAIVAWLRAEGRATSEYYADCVEQGDHEVSP